MTRVVWNGGDGSTSSLAAIETGGSADMMYGGSGFGSLTAERSDFLCRQWARARAVPLFLLFAVAVVMEGRSPGASGVTADRGAPFGVRSDDMTIVWGRCERFRN